VLRAFGIVTRPGIVCQPFMGVSGRVEGDPSCSWLVIDEGGLQPSHPLTEPLRRRGRRVQFRYSLSFEAGYQSETGVILPLVTSPRDSWRDFAEHDWRFNPSQGEARDRMILVATKDLHAAKHADAATVRRGRILAVASAFFFANDDFDVNRDFALNAFNWLAEREYRLSVSPLRRSESLVDFERSSAKPILIYTLLLVLPGLCMAIGATVFLRRRT